MSSPILLFLRTNRRQLAELLLAGMFVNTAALALPLVSMLVYDKAVGNRIHDTLWALTLGMGLVLLLDLCVRLCRTLIVEHAGTRWDIHLDEQLARGVLSAPGDRAPDMGVVLTGYRDLSASRDFLSAQFLLPLADLPFVLLYAAAMALVAGPLVLIPLGIGAATVMATGALHTLGHTRQQTSNQCHASKLSTLIDMLLARDSLMNRHAALHALSRFRMPSRQGARASARARIWLQTAHQLVPAAMTVTTVLTLVVGVLRIETQSMSVGALISGNMLGARLFAAMCFAAPLFIRWREFRRALLALRDAVNLDQTVEAAVATPLPSQAVRSEGIRLEQVGFQWPTDDRKILEAISLHLRPGELVAIVGSSGAGKTTLLRLLAGQLAPTSGDLSYGGMVIQNDLQRRALMASVAMKSQDPSYFHGTVAQIVDPEGRASEEPAQLDRLLMALRDAGLGPAMDRGELGLNTLVKTNGVGLSGGQRQMLAVARTLFSAGPLRLLDEPTLGLDRPAQDALLSALSAHRSEHCTVVATHLTELIQKCDRVLVLDRGKLVADGSPARLLSPNPPVSAPPKAAAAAAATAAALA